MNQHCQLFLSSCLYRISQYILIMSSLQNVLKRASVSSYLFSRHALQHIKMSYTVKRNLNLQEYQSKKLMEKFEINVQKFDVAEKPEAAGKIGKELLQGGANELVIKAQILAGGRGKGTFSSGLQGGVHLTKDSDHVPTLCKDMLGYNLVTKQTAKDGVKVNKVMVAEALDITRETYFAILMDRSYNGPVMVGSPEGGVDIEEVAEKSPELIFKEPIDIITGIQDQQAETMAENLGFTGAKKDIASEQIKRLYELFVNVDATQVEINPFGETPDGRVVCFDAKVNFDDNAEFRQRDIFDMDDKSETDPKEIEATRHNLNYIAMDGNIACLVNGAGLAMATMDIIQHHGGTPANFLDLGGGVKEDQVHEAFKIVSSDSNVKAILVNIFAGIVNCATIANGVVKAFKLLDLKVPLVVRLDGNNADEAKRILQESNLPIAAAISFEDAAVKAVASVQT